MGTTIFSPAGAEALENPPAASRTTASTVRLGSGAVVLGRTTTWLLSMFGVIDRLSMCAALTGSSQTVCQIPLVEVYQMPLGLRTCLPRGWVLLSVGSETE